MKKSTYKEIDKLTKRLHEMLEEINEATARLDEMENNEIGNFGDKSERWQESEKGLMERDMLAKLIYFNEALQVVKEELGNALELSEEIQNEAPEGVFR